MAGGLAIFEHLFPGFGEQLARAGAIPFDFGEHAALRLAHGWLPRFHSGITTYACSRALLEGVLHRQVQGDPAIQLR
ncbi:MAG: hypothetical protein KDK70_39780, partial [Myxococcales bacterium]|nr:hypothetical protein [Myxococcales bacterium]